MGWEVTKGPDGSFTLRDGAAQQVRFANEADSHAAGEAVRLFLGRPRVSEVIAAKEAAEREALVLRADVTDLRRHAEAKVAVVKFASGALGIIHGTTAAYPGLDASLRIFGSKGSAIISNDELTFFHENAGQAMEIAMPDPVAAPNQVTDGDKLTAADQALGKGHQAQLADFANAVRTGGPVRVGTAEARTSLSVILALYESAASGQPVRLAPMADVRAS